MNYFNKIFPVATKLYDNWQLTNGSLLRKIKAGSPFGSSFLHIDVDGNPDKAKYYLSSRHGIPTNEYGDIVCNGITISISHRSKIETVKCFEKEYSSIAMRYPVCPGAILNEFMSEWEIAECTLPKTKGWMTGERKREAIEELGIIIECAKKAGVYEKMFLAFGALLGYAIKGDMLENDDDIDVNFLPLTEDEVMGYLVELKNAGMTSSRMKGPETVNGKTMWFSVGRKSISDGGVKCCNWMWFNHGGYWWHSKGNGWLEKTCSSPTGKGIPESIFDGSLKKISFCGHEINAPDNIGGCLDWWYPGWILREQCSSRRAVELVMDESMKINCY